MEEQQKRREAGLCFNSDEHFHKGHCCKVPRKVLCLEATEKDLDDVELTLLRSKSKSRHQKKETRRVSLYTLA